MSLLLLLAGAPATAIDSDPAHHHLTATVSSVSIGVSAIDSDPAHHHLTATVSVLVTTAIDSAPAHHHLTPTESEIDTEGVVWMSASATVPTQLPEVIWNQWWIGHEIRVRLYGPGMSFTQDGLVYADELDDELPTAGGYVSGGHEITDKSTERIDAINRVRLLGTMDPIVVSGSLSAAFAAAIDVDSGDDATSPVLSVFDFDGLKTSETVFEVAPGEDGWLLNNVSVPA